MKEIHVCRKYSHDAIDTYLDARQGWINEMRSKNFGGSWRSYGADEPITDQIRRDCHEFCEFLIQNKDQHKLVISVNWGWFYTNDLKLIRELTKFSFVKELQQTEATVTLPRGSIRILSSPNRYRSYFRGKRLTEQQRENLATFITNNLEIRISPAFKEWLDRKWGTWVRDTYFIDYDNEYVLTMLGLVCNDVIRKTVTIVNDK